MLKMNLSLPTRKRLVSGYYEILFDNKNIQLIIVLDFSISYTNIKCLKPRDWQHQNFLSIASRKLKLKYKNKKSRAFVIIT